MEPDARLFLTEDQTQDTIDMFRQIVLTELTRTPACSIDVNDCWLLAEAVTRKIINSLKSLI